MAKGRMRRQKHKADQDMPKGKLKRVEDFLPAPEKLIFPSNKKSNKT